MVMSGVGEPEIARLTFWPIEFQLREHVPRSGGYWGETFLKGGEPLFPGGPATVRPVTVHHFAPDPTVWPLTTGLLCNWHHDYVINAYQGWRLTSFNGEMCDRCAVRHLRMGNAAIVSGWDDLLDLAAKVDRTTRGTGWWVLDELIDAHRERGEALVEPALRAFEAIARLGGEAADRLATAMRAIEAGR